MFNFCEFLRCILNREMRRKTTNENKKFKETKALMSNSYLIRQSFKGTVVNWALSVKILYVLNTFKVVEILNSFTLNVFNSFL